MMTFSKGLCADLLKTFMYSTCLTLLLLILHRTETAMIIASMRHQPTMTNNEEAQGPSEETCSEHKPNQAGSHARSEDELDAEPSTPIAENTPIASGSAERQRSSTIQGDANGANSEGAGVVPVETAHEAKLRKQREASKRTRDGKKRTIQQRKEQKEALDQKIATITAYKEDLARKVKERKQDNDITEEIMGRYGQRIEEEERRGAAQREAQARGATPQPPHHR